MIKGLEHVGLCAENPKALADWYVAVLEFSLVRELPEQRTYFIRASDGNMLEVYPAQHPTEQVDNLHQGYRHIGLSVTDLDGEVERLRFCGVIVPREFLVRNPVMKLAFFCDPEGNLIHLVERTERIP